MTVSARTAYDPATTDGLTNLEGRHDFDVHWPWGEGALAPGLTVVLRVKNEARSLRWVLPPLFTAADHIVVVDNLSEDGTAAEAARVAAAHGRSDQITLTEYPFRVSRCGPEHLATPERSLHSLAYFYNWAFAHARTRYSMKWDGDMVLTREGAATIADVSWQLAPVETVARMPRHPLFVADERVAYLDHGMLNVEPWISPNGPDYTFVKAFEWEMRMSPDRVGHLALPGGMCVELKYLDGDEFGHWSHADAFATSERTKRKRREWEVFNALSHGRDIEGVRRIESPDERHVIDYVTQTWLPQASRPITPVQMNL